jgi:hypothetical protein
MYPPPEQSQVPDALKLALDTMLGSLYGREPLGPEERKREKVGR